MRISGKPFTARLRKGRREEGRRDAVNQFKGAEAVKIALGREVEKQRRSECELPGS